MTPQRVDTLKAIRGLVWMLRAEIEPDENEEGFTTGPLPPPPKKAAELSHRGFWRNVTPKTVLQNLPVCDEGATNTDTAKHCHCRV